MRVTTQMVNNSAIKAGLSPRQTSLLNYINQGDGGNALVNAIAKSNTQNGSTNVLQRKNYAKTEEAARDLQENVNVLLESRNSIFERAAESGDISELVKQIKKTVEAFNDTIGILEADGSALNCFYAESLKDVAEESKALLAKVGITLEENGTLSVDKEVLGSADLETLEAVFGKDGSFSEKTTFTAGRVADNASAHLDSVSNQYTQSGDLYSQILARKFDKKG